ncbi:PXA domain-containing protein [Limtongia smithiae]|uniref:PXA domain-containing protein n=1 Tax=Limtongia smithiae TaxID=1125753 RepID=UPI0034CD3F60
MAPVARKAAQPADVASLGTGKSIKAELRQGPAAAAAESATSAAPTTLTTNGGDNDITTDAPDGTTTPQLAVYYQVVMDFFANATPHQLALVAGVVIPALAFLFGIPLFFMLVGIGIGIGVSFHVLNPWRDGQPLQELPWKRGGKTRAAYFSGEFRPVIQSSYVPGEPVENAIKRAVDMIITGYVDSWYSPLDLDDPSFVSATRQALIDTANAFAYQQASKRPEDLFLVLVFSTVNTFIVFLRELRTVVESFSTSDGGIHDYIVAYPESALAQTVDPEVQKQKLRNASNNLVQTFLPVLDIRRSPIALLLRGILSKYVLEAIVDSFSDPDAVNGWIIYFLQKEKNIKELAKSYDANSSDAARKATGVDSAGSPGASVQRTHSQSSVQLSTTTQAGPRPSTDSRRPLSLSTRTRPKSSIENNHIDAVSAQSQRREVQRKPVEISEDLKISEFGAIDSQDITASFDSDRTPTADTYADAHSEAETPSGGVSRKLVDGDITSMEIPSVSGEPQPSRMVYVPPTSFEEMFQLPEFSHTTNNAAPRSSLSGSNHSAPQPGLSVVSTSPSSISSQPTTFKTSPPAYPRRQPPVELPAHTLFESHITVIDSTAENKQLSKVMSSRPSGFYSLVIEPADAAPGWMAMRNIAEFENLHSVLHKLATLAGITSFPDIFPQWSGSTRAEYCQELQIYIQRVVNTRELADCEAMKKFVDKKEGPAERRWQKPPAILKHAQDNVREAISKATQQKRNPQSRHSGPDIPSNQRMSLQLHSGLQQQQQQQQGLRLAGVVNAGGFQNMLNGPDFSGIAASVRTFTNNVGGAVNNAERAFAKKIQDAQSAFDGYNSSINNSTSSLTSMDNSNAMGPRPSSIVVDEPANMQSAEHSDSYLPDLGRQTTVASVASASASAPSLTLSETHSSSDAEGVDDSAPVEPIAAENRLASSHPRSALDDMRPFGISTINEPLTQSETNSIIDTVFKAVTEVFLLSNAWNVRRSLLTVLRGLLLRDGSSSVEGIRQAVQKDIVDKYSSEEELSRKLHDVINAVWPDAERTAMKEQAKAALDSRALKEEARKMFISNAMPDAIKSVMGTAASAQALEYVFDVLQNKNIARGLVLDLLMDVITTSLM